MARVALRSLVLLALRQDVRAISPPPRVSCMPFSRARAADMMDAWRNTTETSSEGKLEDHLVSLLNMVRQLLSLSRGIRPWLFCAEAVSLA